MPYKCAKAICATFCYPIAGALIPLFGPGFLSECRRPGTPGYRDMTIDPQVIEEATSDARAARSIRMQPNMALASRPTFEHRQHADLEARPRQASYGRNAMPEHGRLIQLSPQRAPSSWRAINKASSPLTPPRSSNSQRAVMSGNVDSFRKYEYVEDTQSGIVLLRDETPEPVCVYEKDDTNQDHHSATNSARAPLLPVVEGYGSLKRRLLPPGGARVNGGSTSDRQHHARLPSRDVTNVRRRTHRDASRRMEDYHAATALVGLQGEQHNHSRG